MKAPPALPDLHRHLDGSLRPATVLDLARALRLAVPPDLTFHAGMGLQAALARFGFTLSLLQDEAAVRRVAAEIVEDAIVEDVTTLEVRFAPQFHRGASMDRIVDAALDGLGGRAGLILCGLYGDPPELLEALVDLAIPRRGVVGLDLAGGPIPTHEYGLSSYAAAFTRARAHGIGITVHAGEGRPPAEIGVAIEVLGAQRIGHGTSLLDDPRVLDLVLERGVTIEACPTSNVHTDVIPTVRDHPLPRWLELGVRACVNTDNTLFSGVAAPEELRRVSGIPGMTPARCAQVVANGHAARFTR
ncbi:adenosine deaminase [Deltaproteobacteria bacterium]|nr:adenosine deaminase [Deltaproteobacteria bacterium]